MNKSFWIVGGSDIPICLLIPVHAMRTKVSYKDVLIVWRKGIFCLFVCLFVTSALVGLSVGFCGLGFRADPSLGEWRALDSWPR